MIGPKTTFSTVHRACIALQHTAACKHLEVLIHQEVEAQKVGVAQPPLQLALHAVEACQHHGLHLFLQVQTDSPIP